MVKFERVEDEHWITCKHYCMLTLCEVHNKGSNVEGDDSAWKIRKVKSFIVWRILKYSIYDAYSFPYLFYHLRIMGTSRWGIFIDLCVYRVSHLTIINMQDDYCPQSIYIRTRKHIHTHTYTQPLTRAYICGSNFVFSFDPSLSFSLCF